MLGFVNAENLSHIMAETSIIVIPSKWNEPFGLVAAEAMSNGIAIVSSNSGGLPEIISKNGILIDKINSKKISKYLKQILSNTLLLKELQKQSWENFNFNSKKISLILLLFQE